MPLFDHSFEPAGVSALGNQIDLSIREVEDAGLLEILQTPGARLGTWSILNALLDPASNFFTFKEPIGQSREIKTALSGLFGRFVARAYATKYLNLTHYATIYGESMPVGVGSGIVRRISSGDRPDWVCHGSSGLAIVEAKGCHDAAGPRAALDRAFDQTSRVKIEIGGKTAPHKRYAIATRWGFSTPWTSRPMLWVKDPEEQGDHITPEESERLRIGVGRRHFASFLHALGKLELSGALYSLVSARDLSEEEALKKTARNELSRSDEFVLVDAPGLNPDDRLVGGFVTRSGVSQGARITQDDLLVLERLSLAPTFVGVDKSILLSYINGEKADSAAALRVQSAKQISLTADGPKADGTGLWIYRFGQDRGRVLGGDL